MENNEFFVFLQSVFFVIKWILSLFLDLVTNVYIKVVIDNKEELFLLVCSAFNFLLDNISISFIISYLKFFIIYIIVGRILEIFNIKKGEFGRIVGKISFYIVGISITALINCILYLLNLV